MARHFKIEPLDPNRIIKVNDLKQITNPIPFSKNGVVTPDGLLSNDIFGITKEDRSSTFAYISLEEYFIHPFFYKIWSKMDSKIKNIVHETDTYKINSAGEFVQDPDGETGIPFLKKNIDKIKIKSTTSSKRDKNIQFLLENKDKMFLNNIIIIPAFYRDVNTANARLGIGEINKLYQSLLIAVKALADSHDYGFSLAGAQRGRIQNIITDIYTWFCEENISKKFGILRRSNLNKTTDYGTRLVMTAPKVNVEKLEDLEVDLDYSAIPLASVCSNFYPFIIYNMRRFFENEFSGSIQYPIKEKNGNIRTIEVEDYQIAFSDERLKKEIERFQHGYSNRFIPVKIPNKENREIYMKFKGSNITLEEFEKNKTGRVPVLERDLTWCDIIYQAAIEAVKDRHVLITRYPIDSITNQFPTKIRVSSTKETEPMIIENEYIPRYPKIRQEDIGTNTSNKFVDTANICNCYLGGIGGDYDGDQITVRGIFSDEANAEQAKHLESPFHYINLSGKNIRTGSNEAIQAVYNLTLLLPDTKHETPIF